VTADCLILAVVAAALEELAENQVVAVVAAVVL
jgi:hypothetical protein